MCACVLVSVSLNDTSRMHRSQAQIPVDPIKEFTIADPSLLADKDSSLDDATSQATACSVDLLWLSFALAICWTVTYIYNPILV